MQTEAKHDFFCKLIEAKLIELLANILKQDAGQDSNTEDDNNLEVIKNNAAEILTNCIQILPSIVIQLEII
jgi:hypothetical protein